MEHFANPNLRVAAGNHWFFGFMVGERTSICDCLLTPMTDVQAEDVLASFLFVGDRNGHHHREWLGSKITNRHDVAILRLNDCDSRSR